MIGSRFTESVVEDAAVVWLELLGYAVLACLVVAVDVFVGNQLPFGPLA